MNDHILIERNGPVQVIRMNRPDKRNALTRAMYQAMSQALAAGDADPGIRVHVFLGVPGAFSSGNDLNDFMAIATGGEGGLEVWNFLEALASSQKPIISGVDGIAVGIGATLNLHCDLTFATPRTVFRTPFVDLGLVPEAGSSLLAPAVLGRQQAFALLGLGEGFSAGHAKEAGLIYAVVEEDRARAGGDGGRQRDRRQAARGVEDRSRPHARLARRAQGAHPRGRRAFPGAAEIRRGPRGSRSPS